MKKLSILLAISLCSFLSDQREPLTAEEYAKLTESQKRNVEHALDGIELKDPELELSLFASEPMMTNPTNMDIDAKGRVWICEAYNYRNALNPRNPYNPNGGVVYHIAGQIFHPRLYWHHCHSVHHTLE